MITVTISGVSITWCLETSTIGFTLKLNPPILYDKINNSSLLCKNLYNGSSTSWKLIRQWLDSLTGCCRWKFKRAFMLLWDSLFNKATCAWPLLKKRGKFFCCYFFCKSSSKYDPHKICPTWNEYFITLLVTVM